jgi:hypothetical protein
MNTKTDPEEHGSNSIREGTIHSTFSFRKMTSTVPLVAWG